MLHIRKFRCYVFIQDLLWGFASWSEKWAEEVKIRRIHLILAIGVFPPAAAEIARVTGAEFGHPVFEFLKWALKGKWIFHLRAG